MAAEVDSHVVAMAICFPGLAVVGVGVVVVARAVVVDVLVVVTTIISTERDPILQMPLLVVARKLTTSREMLLWMTPSEAPKALKASECSELLDPMRANCWAPAQH